jgi:succinyl-CoA synthetase alpha subunit
MEAAEAGIKVIVCITEGIPVKDMVMAREYIRGKGCTLIGPNCPGVITADECKVGIMPGFVFKKGKVGIVSKSGTLTYEAADQVVKAGWASPRPSASAATPSSAPPRLEAVQLFANDPETEAIVMIGEIGGDLEIQAANGSKPTARNPSSASSPVKPRPWAAPWATPVPSCPVPTKAPPPRRR